jgi:hypothetical protein
MKQIYSEGIMQNFSALKQVVYPEPLDYKGSILFKTMLHRVFVTAEQVTCKVAIPFGKC